MTESMRRRRFEAIYATYYHAIMGYALRRTDTADDAADVVAETFVIAWRRLDVLPSGDEAKLWLYGTARKVLANHRRGEHRRTRLADRLRDDIREAMVVTAGPDDGIEVEGVIAALRRLRPEDREMLTLVAWEGLDRSELATVLDCSRNAVRIRLHRARKHFALELGRVDEFHSLNPVPEVLKFRPNRLQAGTKEETN